MPVALGSVLISKQVPRPAAVGNSEIWPRPWPWRCGTIPGCRGRCALTREHKRGEQAAESRRHGIDFIEHGCYSRVSSPSYG